MREFDAFHGYPEPTAPRFVSSGLRTIHNRILASYRGRDFYDGDRKDGYGGMINDGRWEAVAKNIFKDYNLTSGSKVLQVNAHKGFLLYELHKLGCRTTGTEVSEYACANSMVRLTQAPFTKLPFEDGEFDLVIAASAVYSHNLQDAIQCLKEIQRVGKKAWITLAAYESPEDFWMLRWWFLLGTTILTKAEWLAVMHHAGYEGDFRFDTAKSLNLVMEPE